MRIHAAVCRVGSAVSKVQRERFCGHRFPCDQFGHQEPGTDEDILSFCEVNFGVTFPLMKKVDVNGKDAIPLYNKFLKKRAGGFLFSSVKWKFTKFLVSRDDKAIKRYGPHRETECDRSGYCGHAVKS
jgi:glutathione peroxidase-family protein